MRNFSTITNQAHVYYTINGGEYVSRCPMDDTRGLWLELSRALEINISQFSRFATEFTEIFGRFREQGHNWDMCRKLTEDEIACSDLTPSDARVIGDFVSWCIQTSEILKSGEWETINWNKESRTLIFSYFNLNTGSTMICNFVGL